MLRTLLNKDNYLIPSSLTLTLVIKAIDSCYALDVSIDRNASKIVDSKTSLIAYLRKACYVIKYLL